MFAKRSVQAGLKHPIYPQMHSPFRGRVGNKCKLTGKIALFCYRPAFNSIQPILVLKLLPVGQKKEMTEETILGNANYLRRPSLLFTVNA